MRQPRPEFGLMHHKEGKECMYLCVYVRMYYILCMCVYVFMYIMYRFLYVEPFYISDNYQFRLFVM
jgi:hypothetical protein